MSVNAVDPEVPSQLSAQPETAARRGAGMGWLWKLSIAGALMGVVGGIVWKSLPSGGANADEQDLLLHVVKRADFEAFVTESGDIESSNSVEIRCQVKSEGGGAITILEIVEEGELVEKGDFLVQFDDSALKLILTQQEIVVATDEKAVIEAQSELDKATQTLNEYRDGLFLVDRETFESELLQAESALKTAQDALDHSERLFRKGYVSRLQLEAQRVAVEQAGKSVKVAETKLRVHNEFTFDRMVNEYEAEIKKQKAALKAAEFTLQLSQQRRDDVAAQIKLCRVMAPVAGQVVFANDFERQQNVVIEEGAQVREGQIVILLPNPEEMHVRARINDSKIRRVKLNNPVRIELDVNPDLPVKGIVSKVNPFPYPRQWFGGPIEYGVEIRIVDPPPQITPGQRAKAQIFVEKLEDVVQVPIQSVLERDGVHYCLVRTPEGQWRTRQVAIGSDNGSFVVLQQGMNEGEQVALNPDLLWEDVAEEKSTKKTANVPVGTTNWR